LDKWLALNFALLHSSRAC